MATREQGAQALAAMRLLRPYDIQDIDASRRMMSLGLTGATEQIGSERKQFQEYGANNRVGDLLSGMNTENFEQVMPQARVMMPYASQAMQNQGNQAAQDIGNQRSYNIQKATFDMQKRDYDNKQQSMAAIQGLLGGNPEAYMKATPEARYAADMAFKEDSEKMVSNAQTQGNFLTQLNFEKEKFASDKDYRKQTIGLQYAQLKQQKEEALLRNKYAGLEHLIKMQNFENTQFEKNGGMAYNPTTGKIKRMPDKTQKLDGWVMMPYGADQSKFHNMVVNEKGVWKIRDQNRMAETTKFQSLFHGSPDTQKAVIDRVVNTLGKSWYFGDSRTISNNQKNKIGGMINNVLADPRYADELVQGMNDPDVITQILQRKAQDDSKLHGRGEYIRPKSLGGRVGSGIMNLFGALDGESDLFGALSPFENVSVLDDAKAMQEVNDYKKRK